MKRIAIITLTIALTSCLGGVPKYKEAQFNREPQEVINELKSLYGFEDANIKWTVSRFGDKVSHNLKVFLTNGKNIPKEDSLRGIIAKEATQLVLNSIENDTAYTDFIVYFINETKNGVVNMRTETPYSFELSEFE